MGNRDGRVRFHRRHVSVLCCFARNRSAFASRRLHFRLPAAARSVTGRFDEIAGENLPRALLQRTETGTHPQTPGSARMTGQEALVSLSKSFGEKIQNRMEFRGEITFTIAASDLREIAKFCRDELSFDYLIDVTSIDTFGEEPRFEIVYELYSMPSHVYVRLNLHVAEDLGAVYTVSDIWPTAK